MEKEKLELRMYGFTMYNLSEIQKGIQFGHTVVEYGLKHFKDKDYQDWANNHKTFIILNGGTSNSGEKTDQGSMEDIHDVLVGEGINGTIKRAVNRPRPYQQLANIRHVDRGGVQISAPAPVEKGRSMPSSHVANNAAFAVLAGAIYGRWGRLTWIAVFVIAYSRIYVGSHYPSDVAVALVLALIYSRAIVCAARRLWQIAGPKWFVRLYDQYPTLLPVHTRLASTAPAKPAT